MKWTHSIPQPPVPPRLRETLKDYPEIIQNLEEILDGVMTEGPLRFDWAITSARFAELTKGEFRAGGSGAAPDRVFGAVELPRVIANPQVTMIEAMPRQTLAKVVAAQGITLNQRKMQEDSHDLYQRIHPT